MSNKDLKKYGYSIKWLKYEFSISIFNGKKQKGERKLFTKEEFLLFCSKQEVKVKQNHISNNQVLDTSHKNGEQQQQSQSSSDGCASFSSTPLSGTQVNLQNKQKQDLNQEQWYQQQQQSDSSSVESDKIQDIEYISKKVLKNTKKVLQKIAQKLKQQDQIIKETSLGYQQLQEKQIKQEEQFKLEQQQTEQRFETVQQQFQHLKQQRVRSQPLQQLVQQQYVVVQNGIINTDNSNMGNQQQQFDKEELKKYITRIDNMCTGFTKGLDQINRLQNQQKEQLMKESLQKSILSKPSGIQYFRNHEVQNIVNKIYGNKVDFLDKQSVSQARLGDVQLDDDYDDNKI